LLEQQPQPDDKENDRARERYGGHRNLPVHLPLVEVASQL
jgi:hypothetical protein